MLQFSQFDDAKNIIDALSDTLAITPFMTFAPAANHT